MNTYEGSLNGHGLRFAIVCSRFNDSITERLIEGARKTLRRHGVAEDDIDLYLVPGGWEIPVVAKRVAEKGNINGIIALGLVIKGDTAHFDYVAGEAAKVGAIATTYDIPVANGVLTTNNWEQAIHRAGGKMGNKGEEAAIACLETANLLREHLA